MSATLLLNIDYTPISILPLSVIGWQHAIKLLVLDKVTVIEEYDDWQIRSARVSMNVPAVCVTKDYFNFKRLVHYSRHNMYLRDLYQCQYCGDTFDYNDLTIDHVIPRRMGGTTNWENCVTSCFPCNSKKGDRLQKPLRAAFRPDYYNLVGKWKSLPVTINHPSWYKYIGIQQPVAQEI